MIINVKTSSGMTSHALVATAIAVASVRLVVILSSGHFFQLTQCVYFLFIIYCRTISDRYTLNLQPLSLSYLIIFKMLRIMKFSLLVVDSCVTRKKRTNEKSNIFSIWLGIILVPPSLDTTHTQREHTIRLGAQCSKKKRKRARNYNFLALS